MEHLGSQVIHGGMAQSTGRWDSRPRILDAQSKAPAAQHSL